MYFLSIVIVFYGSICDIFFNFFVENVSIDSKTCFNSLLLFYFINYFYL